MNKPVKSKIESKISLKTKTLLVIAMAATLFVGYSFVAMSVKSVVKMTDDSSKNSTDNGLGRNSDEFFDIGNHGYDGYCKKIFGEADTADAMNIFFVGAEYDENQIFCGSACDYSSNDKIKILENDVNRFLRSENPIEGHGLLTVEPFKSNRDKINIYMLSTPFNNCSGMSCYNSIVSFIQRECDAYIDNDVPLHVNIVLGNNNFSGGGAPGLSGISRRYQSGFDFVVSNFLHEFGHNLGLHDYYGTAYWPGNPPMMEDSYSVSNCDNTAGCEKWCRGEPLPPFSMTCAAYTDEATCITHSGGVGGGCQWLEEVDPYFNSQCINNSDFAENNIGTDCLEGTGCYWGCLGAGFRPMRNNNFVDSFSPSKSESGGWHVYDPVSERFIEDIFDCCYPSSCDNYDIGYCSDFSSRYSSLLEAYGSCNICQ